MDNNIQKPLNEEPKNRREQLEATKPKREDFPNQTEFEEAHGFWMSRTGRFLSMNKETLQQQEPQYQEPDAHQRAMHDEYTEWFTKTLLSPDAPQSEPQ